MDEVRVMLADDHMLVRTGIRVVMQSIPGVEIVAETGDGCHVLALVEQHQPDVVMMDISMPTMSGLEATTQLKAKYPETHVLILSVYDTEEYVLQALRAGANGYLLKDADAPELQLALLSVLHDKTYISPSVSKHVTDYVHRVGSDADLLQSLTLRQRQILQMIAEGYTTREAAMKLAISPKTVETHKARLMERLDIYDVPGLTRYAIRCGLVTLN